MGETFVQKAAAGSVCAILTKACNLTNHEKSGKISVPAQWQARFNVTFEGKYFDIHVV